jgi:hypothetical protein
MKNNSTCCGQRTADITYHYDIVKMKWLIIKCFIKPALYTILDLYTWLGYSITVLIIIIIIIININNACYRLCVNARYSFVAI